MKDLKCFDTNSITSIEQFIKLNLDITCSENVKTEARIFNSFLKRLIDLGFCLVSASDGEESHPIVNNERFRMLEVVFSVDESSVTIVSNDNELFLLSIVLGNGDATMIYNHSNLSEKLEQVVFSQFAESVKTHSEELYQLNWSDY